MQPNPRPSARQALDDGLIAILMVLRALIMGHLPRHAMPLRCRRIAALSSIPRHEAPAARPRARLECVLIGPATRERPMAAHAFGRAPHPRGTAPFRPVAFAPAAGLPPAQPEPRSQPPPPASPWNRVRRETPCRAYNIT